MKLTPTPWQQHVALSPDDVDLAVLGGRGAGKSWALAFLIVQAAERQGGNLRALYVRRSQPSLRDFETVLRRVLGAAYPTAQYNSNKGVWNLPQGGTVELGELAGEQSLSKYIGRSLTLLIVDQAEQYGAPELIDLMRSNLRGEGGVEPRFILCAHPGGAGDTWIYHRYVAASEAWKVFQEESSGRDFIRTDGTFRDNPHLSDAYAIQLEAATASDEYLRLAWLDGNFASGALAGTSPAHSMRNGT